MNILKTTFIMALLSSCNSSIIVEIGQNNQKSSQTPKLNNLNSDPKSYDLIPKSGVKNREKSITLNFDGVSDDSTLSCRAFELSNLIETSSCRCSSGVCAVGVTGLVDYVGNVSFKYSVSSNGKESNAASASFLVSTLGASDSDEWIRIPANAGDMGLDEFFVMKYEAKAWNDENLDAVVDAGEASSGGNGPDINSFIPISIPENQPWRNIDADDATAECESLGVNYHLISNEEWMAIARDIEQVHSNWTGGAVGSGCMFRGNSGETTCGYDATGDPDSGLVRNSRAKYTLSNAEEIFDLSGNVLEWTDWDKDTLGFQLAPIGCLASWTEIPSVSCGALLDSDFNSINGSYTSTEGAGLFYGGFGGAAQRGGDHNDTNRVGPYMLHLSSARANINLSVGFRCVYRPQRGNQIEKRGDAPTRLPRDDRDAWRNAWAIVEEIKTIEHKADYEDTGEAWSSVVLSSNGGVLLAGGDIYSGRLGISGQTMASSAVQQEIDGTEAIRFELNSSFKYVKIKLSEFYPNDDGSGNNESIRIQGYDDSGTLVGESVTSAHNLSGSSYAILRTENDFVKIIITSGVYNGPTFVYGGLANSSGRLGAAPLGPNGSEFLISSIEFQK